MDVCLFVLLLGQDEVGIGSAAQINALWLGT